MLLRDTLFLLLTGLVSIYVLWRFFGRWRQRNDLHDLYYALGFLVLLVSGLLLIFFGYGILASPYVLTVASLIPLGLSLGIANQYFPSWKQAYAWFALLGFLAIAITSIGGFETGRKISVPIFHGIAGLVLFLGPLFAPSAPRGFWWVAVGGALIGLGGIALAFLSAGSQLLFFSQSFVLLILAPLLLLMSGAFGLGFKADLDAS